jgi:hypothetical protein
MRVSLTSSVLLLREAPRKEEVLRRSCRLLRRSLPDERLVLDLAVGTPRFCWPPLEPPALCCVPRLDLRMRSKKGTLPFLGRPPGLVEKAGCDAFLGRPLTAVNGEGFGSDEGAGGEPEEAICWSSERSIFGMLIGFDSVIVGRLGFVVTGVPEIFTIILLSNA